MKRQLVWLIMICVLLSILVSCGAKEMTDVDKGEEISARFAQDYNQHQFISIDVSVDSVQRDSEDDAEETWGQVVGETETIIITCPYYSKHSYEEGSWSLKQLRFGDAEIEIKVEPITENDLEADGGTALLFDYCNDALSIDTIVIDDRITDYSALEEKITFTVNVSEPDANGWFSAEATYVLGVEKWEMKDWNVLDSGVEIIGCSIPQDAACSDMLAFYTDRYDEEIDDCIYLAHNCVAETTSAKFEFQMVQDYGYYSQRKTANLVYDYTLKDGWTAASYTPNAADKYVGAWDVIGEWTYSDSVNSIWVNIISLNENEITYEYEINCQVPYESSWYGLSTEIQKISSDGERTESFRSVDDEDFALRFPITDSSDSCNLYLYPYKGVTFDGRIWNADDTYILSYSNTEKSAQVEKEVAADWPEKTILLYEEPVIHHTGGLTLSTLEFDYGEKDLDDGETLDGSVHHNVMYYADDENEGAASNTYNLYGKYGTLTGTIFLMQGAPLGNSAKVNIYGDGALLYSFDAIKFTKTYYTEDFTIDVVGVRELTVEFTGEYFRKSVFLASYYEALIGLAELTAFVEEFVSKESVATPDESPATLTEPIQEEEISTQDTSAQIKLLKRITESQFGEVVHTTDILYDDNHEPYLSRLTIDQEVIESNISYDAENKSATESCYEETFEGNGYSGSQWIYDDSRIVRQREFYSSGDERWIDYAYDKAGKILSASSTSAIGDLDCAFSYDEQGELNKYIRCETNIWGDVFSNEYTVENIYDESGNLVQRLYYEDGELAIEQNYRDGYLIETNNIQAEYKTTYEYESITVNESDLPRWYYDSTLLLP